MVDIPTIAQLVTREAFEAFTALPENQDRRFELIDDEIVEDMPTHLHRLISKALLLALGSVCKLQTQDDGSEQQGCQIGGNPLVIAGSNCPKVLETTKKALDDVALPIQRCVMGASTLLVALAWDDRLNAAPP